MVGNFNLNDLMKNAQGMMDKAQQKLSKITAIGESGAGLVKIVINAKHDVLELKIADELLKESKEIIEDLIRAAINDANQKITKATQDNMMSLTSLFQSGKNEPDK
ncbi:MAG: nucleoid-associated protein, YbaB/EbfC family [Coxiella sp. RIFCSPHIGHO2_12_FULL_42_15]|nr:MAG: nucleoid-associated protein, YbaB/EbfC family [Coxiella sp. RIFCSPHIGHO2_12_FULL_42_15]